MSSRNNMLQINKVYFLEMIEPQSKSNAEENPFFNCKCYRTETFTKYVENYVPLSPTCIHSGSEGLPLMPLKL